MCVGTVAEGSSAKGAEEGKPSAIYLSDYQEYPYSVNEISLTFDLGEEKTTVHSVSSSARDPRGVAETYQADPRLPISFFPLRFAKFPARLGLRSQWPWTARTLSSKASTSTESLSPRASTTI